MAAYVVQAQDGPAAQDGIGSGTVGPEAGSHHRVLDHSGV